MEWGNLSYTKYSNAISVTGACKINMSAGDAMLDDIIIFDYSYSFRHVTLNFGIHTLNGIADENIWHITDRADSRFVSSHWETALFCNGVSH